MTDVFKTRLKTARKAKNFTQAQLAEEIGTYKTKIVDAEAGFTHVKFTIEELVKLINILDVSADWLLGVDSAPVGMSLELYQQLIKTLKDSADSINNIKDILGGC